MPRLRLDFAYIILNIYFTNHFASWDSKSMHLTPLVLTLTVPPLLPPPPPPLLPPSILDFAAVTPKRSLPNHQVASIITPGS